MRTGFIDDLRNCKQCGSLEHENDLRDDLCPNCYYDVGRFKEEREKTKADNKWLNKWQKLKEWLEEIKLWNEKQMKEARLNLDYYIRAKSQNVFINKMLDKMQELEKGEKDGNNK